MRKSLVVEAVRTGLVTVVAAALLAQPASAQSGGYGMFTGFGGWFIASDVYTNVFNGTSSNVHVGDAFSYGGRLAYLWNSGFGIEGSYERASSGVEANKQLQGYQHVGDVVFNLWDFDFLFTSAKARKPVLGYFAIGLGGTTFSPNIANVEGATKFSWNLGIGAIFKKPNTPVGFRIDGRWRATDTNRAQSGGTVCDPFYGCYSYASTIYNTGTISGGLTIDFK